MAERRTITLRTQWIAQQLRQLREDAKVSVSDIAQYLGRTPSTVSRLETGLLTARMPEVLAYLDICGVDDEARREGLKRLAQQAYQKGWWDGYKSTISHDFADRIWLESRSHEIMIFHQVVPGLLQTRDYAEAVIRADEPDLKDEAVENGIRVRIHRQDILAGNEPTSLNVLLDEVALLRVVGSEPVMLGQLEHLRAMIERPHVSMKIIPLEAGAHAGLAGPFDILRMSEPYPEVGYVETRAGVILVEAESVDALTSAFSHLSRIARPAQPYLDAAIARLQ